MLAFSFQEATELLEDAPSALGEAEIGELHQRTEGWVAGLLLATRSGAAPGLPEGVATGGPHFDYLADEVARAACRPTCSASCSTPRCSSASRPRWRRRSPSGADARDVIRGLLASHLFIVSGRGRLVPLPPPLPGVPAPPPGRARPRPPARAARAARPAPGRRPATTRRRSATTSRPGAPDEAARGAGAGRRGDGRDARAPDAGGLAGADPARGPGCRARASAWPARC